MIGAIVNSHFILLKLVNEANDVLSVIVGSYFATQVSTKFLKKFFFLPKWLTPTWLLTKGQKGQGENKNRVRHTRYFFLYSHALLPCEQQMKLKWGIFFPANFFSEFPEFVVLYPFFIHYLKMEKYEPVCKKV